MYPILFNIGPLSIKTYGTLLAIGIYIGIYIARKRAVKEGVSSDFIVDLGFIMVVAGILGARILYVLTELKFYFYHPLEIFKVWKGGLVFYGGFIAGILVSIKYINNKKMPVWKVIDIFTPSLVLAHSIGRLGCFFRGCCYGIKSKKFGIVFPYIDNYHRIPTQLIESFLLFVLFLFLNKIKYKKFDGYIFFIYLLSYSCIRFMLEFLRDDFRGPVFLGIFSISQFVSILLGVLAIFTIKNKK